MARQLCERDQDHKQHAQGIDTRMHRLHNNSESLGYYYDIENYDNT